jgi:single-strand DNA-binding protein
LRAGRHRAGRAPGAAGTRRTVKETEVTVVGNVVGPPQRNRTANGSVTNFRLASTASRYDRETQAWVDKKPLFLDVECWGELGANVSSTVSKGDPVIVFGELFTDEWESDQGRRSKVTMRAANVGPDLARGTAEFRRTVRSTSAATPPPENIPDPGEEPAGDYDAGSRALYELDSDSTVPEPALH